MDYGMKSTKQGASTSSSNIRDFTQNSGINSLKIFMSGYGVASIEDGEIWTENIVHNLGYKPIIMFFFEHPDTDRFHSASCRTYDAGNVDTPDWDLISNKKHIDDDEVQIRLYDDENAPSYPYNVKYKYYILVDPRKDAWYEPATIDTDNFIGERDYGEKLSRPGIDVKTAEPKNLVYSSAFDTFKEFRIMKFEDIGDKEHGLNYPPTFVALRENEIGEWVRGDASPTLNGGYPLVTVDDTSVYYYTNYAAEDVYIILFINPLNE